MTCASSTVAGRTWKAVVTRPSRASDVRFAPQAGGHSAPTLAAVVRVVGDARGRDAVVAVTELLEDRPRPPVPTRPRQRRIAVHVLGVDDGAGVEQHLDR